VTVTDAPKQLFIGGKWLDAEDGATMPVDDPATGEILCQVADAGPEDGRLAEAAAVAAQEEWARTSPRERSEILRRAYEIILSRTDELALLMTSEMGKPLAEARGEVAYAAEFFRWFSEEAVRIDGGFGTLPDGRNRMLLMRRPVGPCLLVTPWNFPLAMGTRKIGPAIAAGCTMVLKPAPQTPLSSLALAGILAEAGRTACSTSSRPPAPVRWSSRCCAAAGSASCPSPAPPRSAGSCSPSAPAPSYAPPWSWAATRRSSSSRTRTWTWPWTAP
jgi:succinate-semialdehyde dehydrogenase/glutarate-semialdehyde dehydrogenase